MNPYTFLFTCLLASVILKADEITMPPAIPSIGLTPKSKLKTENKMDKTKDSCKIIPPMLIHLPPMLEKDLDICKNKLYLPSKNIAEKKLKKMLKKDIKVKKISILNGFSMLYKVESNEGVFYCNRYISKCLTPNIYVLKEESNRRKGK